MNSNGSDEREEHDELIRKVDDKLDKIDRKLSVINEKVTEARATILKEVRRIEVQIETPKDARGL